MNPFVFRMASAFLKTRDCQKSLAEFRFPQKTEESAIIFSRACTGEKYFSRKESNSPGDCLIKIFTRQRTINHGVRPKGGRASGAQSPRFKKGVRLF